VDSIGGRKGMKIISRIAEHRPGARWRVRWLANSGFKPPSPVHGQAAEAASLRTFLTIFVHYGCRPAPAVGVGL
jgi:hypothetical protein